MKVLKNESFGGFGLSDKAYEWLIRNKKIPFLDVDISKMFCDKIKETVKKKFGEEILCIYKMDDEIGFSKIGMSVYGFAIHSDRDKEIRIHKGIIECFEAIGSKEFNQRCSSAVLVEIPDDIEWEIDEYDGNETIREKHRTW